MCRIAAHLGDPVALKTLLCDPPRSLVEQARAPRDLPPGMVGSDGFGVGWFAPSGAARFRSTLPIWSDENVGTLAPHIEASCFVASSRTAARHMVVSLTNTPPFVAGRALVVHNGAIERFHEHVVESMRARLTPEARRAVAGNTDTEYIAALVASQPPGDIVERVLVALARTAEDARDAGVSAQLTVLVADGDTLVGVRHGVGKDPPALWLREVERSVALSSEPMEPSGWSALLPGDVVVARRQGDGLAIERRSIGS